MRNEQNCGNPFFCGGGGKSSASNSGESGSPGQGEVNQNTIQRVSDLSDVGRIADAALEIASNAADKVEIGAAGEERVRESIIEHGYRIVGEQVYVRTALGLRVVDFVITDGRGLAGIEAKANTATRSSIQLEKDAAIATVGGTVASRNQLSPLLRYGAPVQFNTTEVSVIVVKP